MYDIPTSIQLKEGQFSIRKDGDYRMILDCFRALEDAELTPQEKLYAALIIFYNDLNSISDIYKLGDVEEAVEKMYNFFNCNQPVSVGKSLNHKVIDWDLDSQLICSAINNVAHKEIRLEPYIHWWTFMGYYSAIGECPLSTIITIRHKMLTGKKLEDYEKEFRKENMEFFTWNSNVVREETEEDKFIRELWNSGVKNGEHS